MALVGREKESLGGTTQRGEGAAGENSTVGCSAPFHGQTLTDFVGLVGRYFYDDACIVLLDFLSREQRAFSEADLRERLGWREALVQQKLYLLEKHFLVIQDGAGGYGAQARSVRATTYWRINHKIYAAVLFRYNQLVERLAQLVEDVTRQHEFECSDADCDAKYTALEAAGCSVSLDDEHPLCTHCGSRLRPSAFEETRQKAKEKRTQALSQLDPLRQGLLRMSNMEIPVFAPYSKQEKKLQEQKDNSTGTTSSASGPLFPAESAADLGSAGQKPIMSAALLDRGLGPGNQGAEQRVTLSSASVVSAPGRLRHSDQSSRAQEEGGSSSTVPIPWFESSGAVTATQTPGRPLDVQMSIGMHPLSGEGVASGIATKRLMPAGGAGMTSNHGICFDLKGRGSAKNPTAPSGASISFCLTQGAGKGSSGSYGGVPLSTGVCIAATGSPVSPRASQSQELAGSTTDEGSGLASFASVAELEIYVEKLGRCLKLSDITEEVEQLMTDEEYKIYYNTAEL